MKTNKTKKILRLGVSCLSLLMISALLMVGGSFSKHTSTGEITGIPSLTVAGLKEEDIDVTLEDPGTEYGDNMAILCTVKITNKSEVPVTCSLDFWAHVSEVGGLDTGTLANMKVLLDINGELLSDSYYDVDDFSGNLTVGSNIHVSTNPVEDIDEAIYVKAADDEDTLGEAICAIVFDLSDCGSAATADTLSISPGDHEEEHTNAVTLTVKQAAKEPAY